MNITQSTIRAFAPATVANVACGFDVLGFALEHPGDEVQISIRKDNQLIIQSISGDEGILPLDPKKNTVTVVISEYLKHLQLDIGLDIHLIKKMPLKSGMGSSAASSVVGVYALNELLGRPLKKQELLPFVVKGEEIACGSAHADNVAPALLGGFTLVRSYNPLDIIPLPSPPDLYCTVIHPHILVQTKDARSILRQSIALKDAVIQWGNLGGLIAGLYNSDYDLIGRSLQDVLVEPVRSILIPGFDAAKQAALNAGALGCSISGSGPSIFALSKGEDTAYRVSQAFTAAFDHLNIASETFVSIINQKGPFVIS
jgi:homoserine kinase